MNKDNNMQWLALEHTVIAVTGAGSGIGAAVARGLLEAGASVAMLDVNTDGCDSLLATLGELAAEALVIPCDVSSEASVQQAAARINERFGHLNGLANCAGILRPGALLDVSLDDWNQVLQVNLTGSMLCARAFAPLMGNGGSLVFIASVAALMPQTNSGAYSASKSAVTLMSRQLAVELGNRQIRSNVICPGMIRTALSEPFYAHPGITEAREAMTASGRIGMPSDIANATLFLLSDKSSYINGTEVVVDGGLDNMLMHLIPRPGYSASNN
ncbi:SDR family NAD(P)-dependent oxidoreductase [Oceanobacter mangrovi]|uniref:SDR family NAD(P)-dependent oxidoreductase n=1 Tax=Oceanobacter mangrovi TaxID=2862510 RepID=UPI001C8D7248|nr:SDR family oxidoreductase [Oceanobacter mangrovi]